MRSVHTIVIGGGQAGLAMSRCLSDRSIEHVVLERARIGERWRTERWDSLRLLTPNWMSRLPGYQYDGPDPDDYMTMPEIVRYLERYAEISRVPLETGTSVQQLERSGDLFRIKTDRGVWAARNVVMATGYCDLPAIPRMSEQLPSDILQLAPTEYRNPGQLPAGGVLVVGAAASGVQLAEELAESGRSVTLAVGRHTRMPRSYRGKDILWWLDRMGILAESVDNVFDLDISRHQPAFQLVGRPDHTSIDLGQLSARGIRIVGRARGADGYRMFFEDNLLYTTTSADAKLASLLSRIDAFVEQNDGLKGQVTEAEPFVPTWQKFFSAQSTTRCDLFAEGIRTVIWATGFRRSYPWLRIPVLDERGEIRHDRGITPQPGLCVLGLQFQSRRNSAFIDGVGHDAAELARHIALREAVPSSAVA